jgi:hypothetical protein
MLWEARFAAILRQEGSRLESGHGLSDRWARFVAASMDVQRPSRVSGSRRRVGFSFGLGSSQPAFRKLGIGA